MWYVKQILAEIGEVRRGVEADMSAAQAALEADANEDNEVRGSMYTCAPWVVGDYRVHCLVCHAQHAGTSEDAAPSCLPGV